MSQSDKDDDQTIALWLVFGLVAIAVASVMGFGVNKALKDAADKTVSTITQEKPKDSSENGHANVIDPTSPAVPPTEGGEDKASVVLENGVVKFYFASGSAALAQGANEALGDAVAAAKAGKKLVISGFHDATGDPVKNEELAKQRAISVASALKGLGVAENQLELKKPEVMTGTGTNAQARRVEVAIEGQ